MWRISTSTKRLSLVKVIFLDITINIHVNGMARRMDRNIEEVQWRRQQNSSRDTWKGRFMAIISVALRQLKVSGQLHFPVALSLGKDTTLTIE
jgi:hypothetical protein